ncbi:MULTISPECIES: ISAs1 family transposase [Streptomyces]|nr:MULTISPECIES: ISAs1 family transposase [unclassified Streptomyces]MDX3092954.1 ISAs1 family transposase [Streptomyces sp. ME12-02E]MDX3336333.1 ISAs1 family transposase [Streptomyces sp. ME02-6978a]WTI28920.1 ISAs1 family transposase [Streptomyces jietaisiensis]
MPDPRARRGRWYSLTAVLLVCACAAVSGARSVDEIAEWAARASGTVLTAVGIRRHPLKWRRAPSRTTIGRVLAAVDGDALDRVIGTYLAGRNTGEADSGQRQVIAVDGKSLRGSARLSTGHRHLLSAVTHHQALTLAQAEVGAKTNETAHFRPLLEPLDLDGALVTFDALHSVKANVTWLVETKSAHYIAVIKRNQPTAYRQLAALPWPDVAVQHTASSTGHGRRESRSLKTCGIADELGGIAFPHARLALRVHRRRKQTGRRETRETVYAVTSLDAHQTTPANLATAVRGHWSIEALHHVRDVTFAEDASTLRTGTAPRAMAAFRNLAIGLLKSRGADNIAKTTRAIRDQPERALPLLGITNKTDALGT